MYWIYCSCPLIAFMYIYIPVYIKKQPRDLKEHTTTADIVSLQKSDI